MGKVLIATLGESPIIVTAMYDLLKKEKELVIDKVVVLQPQGGTIPLAFELIREALQDRCEVIAEPLGFEDADDEAKSFIFLHTLYRLLNDERENAVYLSLAGPYSSRFSLVSKDSTMSLTRMKVRGAITSNLSRTSSIFQKMTDCPISYSQMTNLNGSNWSRFLMGSTSR